MSKLTAVCVKVSTLKPAEVQEMFRLFSEYYANVSFAQFENDLFKKDHVFLMRDPLFPDIKGFSTIVAIDAQPLKQGKPVRGFFSGDTVVHQDYWGQGALGVAFLKFLFLQKLRRPFEPLYWFLISKGYKTYLLMANNFPCHYPRYEKPTPDAIQVLLDSFASQLYPEGYDPQLGTIAAPDPEHKDRLKTQVAPIGELLLQQNPRIAFFVEKNPGWKQGNELACLAEMTFAMPFQYQSKVLRKRLLRMIPGLRPTRTLPASDEGATT